MKRKDPVYSRVLKEQMQSHPTRRPLFKKLAGHLGRPVVTYFANMGQGLLDTKDADMLQSILQEMNLSHGLALVINSPGGDGIAAERVINVCRTYSGTGEYWAIVPGKAKSAATMVCFGASKIFMSGSSELGPVDPQIFLEDTRLGVFSVHNLVKTYEDLFDQAVAETDGNLEPYLQQLQHFDVREIGEYKEAIKLSEDIAVRSLGTGMMKHEDHETISEKIKLFTEPDQVKSHARPISREEARSCGLVVEAIDVHEDWWKWLHELYVRTDQYVSTMTVKCMESESDSFFVQRQPSYHPTQGDEE